MSFAAISGWGLAAPDHVVTNEDLAATLDVDPEWIVRRTGIRERRVAGPGETTSTLAIAAANRALLAAGVDASEIDLIVVATTTPDRPCPATAPVVQAALGATRAGAFDVNGACAGFLTALTICTSFIRSGAATRCLAIGAEVLSRVLDWADPSTCVLFGDGAGAVVLERADDTAGLLSFDLGSDGTGAPLITIPAGGSETPTSTATLAANEHVIRMRGREVFRAAVHTMVDASQRSLRSAGLTSSDVDLFICHQANQRIVTACAERLAIPEERVFSNVSRYGNTSAASVAIAVAEAADDGRLRPGDTVLLAAVGAGLVWGSAVARWTAPLVTEPERADALIGAVR